MTNSNVTDNFSQLGIINLNPPTPAPLPPPAKTGKKKKPDPETLLAKQLNDKRDMNRTHAFQFWVAYQSQLNDFGNYNKGGVPIYDAFNKKLHTAITDKLKSNFYGSDAPNDFTTWTPAEIQYYSDFSDFLGINFKKIFGTIGHGIGWVGNEVHHGAMWIGDEADHGLGWAVHAVDHNISQSNAIRDIGNDFKKLAPGAVFHDVVHASEWYGKTFWHEVGKVARAVEPYWKVIVVAALVVVSVVDFGITAPVAIAVGSALLTGLDAIHGPTPPTPIASETGGDGGTAGGDGSDGSGFPQGGPDPGGNGDGGPTPEQLLAQQQQQQAQAAAYEQAIKDRKKKIIMIASGVIAALIIGIIIWHHYHKKK